MKSKTTMADFPKVYVVLTCGTCYYDSYEFHTVHSSLADAEACAEFLRKLECPEDERVTDDETELVYASVMVENTVLH